MAIYGGIDLGGTKIQAAVVDADHKVLGAKRDQTPLKGGPAAIASATSGGPPVVGVGWRACPTTVPESSTTAAWIFVPPRSMPPRNAMRRTYFPSAGHATRVRNFRRAEASVQA